MKFEDYKMGEQDSPTSLKELAEACIAFYETNKDKMILDHVRKKRVHLALLVEDFHKQCGTLTSSVQKRIEDLRDGNCIILMTAHQPNLFAYSGVLRKATLNFALSKELQDRLKTPVINFFGIADQDFTDDHWVKTALLPDVQRRTCVFELRADLPKKRLLNKTAKPKKTVLDGWRNNIEKWLESKIKLVERASKALGLETKLARKETKKNFDGFWQVVEEAHSNAHNFADFNAFTISKIINDAWVYDTLFSRFSDFQQIFEDQFNFLLSHFAEYSRYVKETIEAEAIQGGVFEQEHNVIPFWYHCDCGSKARLMADSNNESLVGRGQCLLCRREYQIDFGPKKNPKVTKFLHNISARSLSMPLVFFEGLKICCYVGGIGGIGYLRQAEHVAEKMNLTFPPIALWRPRDVYAGMGQLEALLTFSKISGTSDFSKLPKTKAAVKKKIVKVQEYVEKIVIQKGKLAREAGAQSKETIDKMKTLWHKQLQKRQTSNYSLLVKNLKLLENIEKVNNMYPSIIDYAVNIGLKSVNEQWLTFLKENGSLTSDVNLKTAFEEIAEGLDPHHNQL